MTTDFRVLTINFLVEVSPKLKGIEKFLAQLRGLEEISELEQAYAEKFLTVEGEGDGNYELMEWMDDSGDLGVGEWKTKSDDEMLELLGLKQLWEGENDMEITVTWQFPFMNGWLATDGTLPSGIQDLRTLHDEDADKVKSRSDRPPLIPLKPMWHQYVGLAAMVKRFYHGKNVILADGVGVGKTMECFMVICYLRFLRTLLANEKTLPPLGELFKESIGGN